VTDQQLQSERLKALLPLIPITQTALSERLGFTRGYISLLTRGKKPISQQVLNEILKCFPRVNIHWLMSGKGEPMLDNYVVKMSQIENAGIRTLEDLEADNKTDPLFGLKEVLADYENRIAALEGRIDAIEREAKVGHGGRT
jgi:transcriptional regulator with XRE-family HTH domain